MSPTGPTPLSMPLPRRHLTASGALLGRATGSTRAFYLHRARRTIGVSGPDGVLTVTTTSGGVTNTTLYAGDGNSTLKIFNATNPAAPTPLQPPISTGGATPVSTRWPTRPRNDSRSSPRTTPRPRHTEISSTRRAGTAPATLLFPGGHQRSPITRSLSLRPKAGPPTGGMEQPAWDPHTGTFFVSIPQLIQHSATDPGGLAQIEHLPANVLRHDPLRKRSSPS